MLLSQLDQRTSAAWPLNQSWSRVSVQPCEIIITQDQSSPDCYKVITGSVRLVRQLSDGRRSIGRFVLRGELVGFELEQESYFAAEAITKGILIRYPRQMIEDLAASSLSITRQLYDLSTRRLRDTCAHMTAIGRHSSCERVVSFLLDMWERRQTPNTPFVELPMGQRDIADYLCLTTETVCRELTELRRTGLIGFRGRRKLIIRDQAALADLASETHSAPSIFGSDSAATDSRGVADRALQQWGLRGFRRTAGFSGIGGDLRS